MIGAVVDPAGAVALNVAVAANRRGAGSGPADVAAQQQHVDELADRIDPMFVLGHAKAPGDDRPLRPDIDVGQLTNLPLLDPGIPDDPLPRSVQHDDLLQR